MNVAVLLSRSAARYETRPALSDGTITRTYAEVDARVTNLASGLRVRGVDPGDRVAILMRNRPEAIEALFAAFRAGMAAVPINARLHPDEVAYIVGHADCRALLFGPGGESAADRCEVPVTIGPDDFEQVIVDGEASGVVGDVDVEPGEVAWLFYTSGTTGRPKGAMLTHRNLLRMVMACLADMTAYRSDDVVLHAAPLSHGAGLYALAAIASGAENVVPLLPTFDPAQILELMVRKRVSAISFVTPTMLVRLLDSADIGRADLSSLRSIVYGGGPAYVGDLRQAVRRFGPILTQLYGQGESPMTITYLSATDHETDRLLGSVGIPHPDIEVRLVDETGRPVPVGEAGEVCVRGDVVMAGYWKDPGATAASIREGWLHTGDVGRLDAAGYLYLLDRSKDLVISGGSNIYPREVEEVLLQHPAVAAVAVVGLPDREWGEAVHAAVVLRSGADASAEELIEFCRNRIASYKKPSGITFVDSLPMSAVGKVLKRELRQQLVASNLPAARKASTSSGSAWRPRSGRSMNR